VQRRRRLLARPWTSDLRPGVQLRIYGDDWKGEPGVKFRWREPGHGHGYWRNGAWVVIK
jgi:hypothetical protein